MKHHVIPSDSVQCLGLALPLQEKKVIYLEDFALRNYCLIFPRLVSPELRKTRQRRRQLHSDKPVLEDGNQRDPKFTYQTRFKNVANCVMTEMTNLPIDSNERV